MVQKKAERLILPLVNKEKIHGTAVVMMGEEVMTAAFLPAPGYPYRS
jgi:hypothetical protein